LQTERERNAAESVEWLAALWELAEGKESQCANPHLLTLLRLSPRVSVHPALVCVAGLRREQSRDRLIKILVEAARQLDIRVALYGHFMGQLGCGVGTGCTRGRPPAIALR